MEKENTYPNYKLLGDEILRFLALDYQKAYIMLETGVYPSKHQRYERNNLRPKEIIEETKEFVNTPLFELLSDIEPEYFLELCERECKKIINNKGVRYYE